uniref:Uncharacterized protein n=1 Tax=Meloidogyne javanica TaxID=6303 RepID=A0A915MHF3_MELJA
MDDLLDSIDASEDQQPAPSSMTLLEQRKQNEARAFSQGLLQSMAGGSNANSSCVGKRSSEIIQSTTDEFMEEGPSSSKKIKDEVEEVEDIDQSLLRGPAIRTYMVKAENNCTHEVVIPEDFEYSGLRTITGDPAKTYEFKLDMFQKQAITCLDNKHSVLVSAHTSAGKTVVALYAIALALRDKQRVIYTSPIKALSNQKYRELAEEFEDVGLMTGDVTLNPNASCIVMTTEILRSMLYRGSEITREIGWVIFDEIHYMRDKERGVVWEETLILMQDTTHFVFLSATIPNAKEFAKWICYLHHQPCHVVYTDTRPVPLQHLIFPCGADGLYEVVDIKGNFKQDNFQKAMNFLVDSQPLGDNVDNATGPPRRSIAGGGGDPLNKSVLKIIRTIHERDMLPCIIFSFSRKECEMYATKVKQMDFNSEEEKRAVSLIFDNAIDLLADEDKKLPQIKNVLPYLLRGIGIHHSGQLPIMKEIVEILFGEGLIKTLFATETFAMGVNMPAKTVLFTSARKFDGTINRWISGGEYIQMSGRAGRRGKDDRGLVILMLDTQMSADQAMHLLKGNSDPLNSQFRLTYNMVLNLFRVPEINPQYMLEKSFYQFQNYAAIPNLRQAMREKHALLMDARVSHEMEIEAYYNIEKRIQQLQQSIKSKILKPSKVVPFFQPGRLLKMKHFDKDYDWTVLINWRKTPNPLDPTSPELIYIVEVAVLVSKESERHLPNLALLKPPDLREQGVICVIPFTFECISAISTIRLKVPQELKSKEARDALAITLAETKKRFSNLIPELDPIEHMGISDPQVKKEIELLFTHEQRYKDHPLKGRPDFDQIYSAYMRKLKLEEEYKEAKNKSENSRKLLQMDELQCRKRVLRRLGYANEEDTITDKGRVACELSSADELLLTEMLFTGAFASMEAEEAAALLTCFVFEEKAPTLRLPENLSSALRNLQSNAKKIAKVCIESKLELDEEKYVEQFSPGMMDVVYNWCLGSSFAQIMENTQLFEGSIIRCMRRLDELLHEMIGASRSLQDDSLVEKFEKARNLLKRDIVFSASLYL